MINIELLRSHGYFKRGLCLFYSTSLRDDYQYLEKSKIPTMQFQESLPKLPIPDLKMTCKKYLRSQKLMLSENDYKRTFEFVDNFQSAIGKDLDYELRVENDINNHSSYLSDMWKDMYLSCRKEIRVNSRPHIGFENETNSGYNEWLIRATNMLISSVRMYKSLNEDLLSPLVHHRKPSLSHSKFFTNIIRNTPSNLSCRLAGMFQAIPLDMDAFKYMFSCSRIPKLGKDELRVAPNSRHVLVIRNGNYYVFDAIDSNGNIYAPTHLMACLKYIIEDPRPVSKKAIGVLALGNRDSWASIRTHLLRIGNKEQFKKIESALFAIIFEDEDLGSDESKKIRNLLLGNPYNRWIDKSFSLIFEKGGTANLAFEHSWGDGIPITRYIENIFMDSTNHHFVHPDSVPAAIDVEACVKTVEFNLDEKTKVDIKSAFDDYMEASDPLKIIYHPENKLTKNFIKSKGLHPDSIYQLSFQLAFYKVHGHLPTSVESCSTARFKYGRVELIRPCTTATKNLIEAVCQQSRPSNAELLAMLTECSKLHRQLIREASMGQGFDCHLLALKDLATRKAISAPDIFTDPAFSIINQNTIEGTTINCDAQRNAAFLPSEINGMCIAYTTGQSENNFVITYNEKGYIAKGFRDAFETSLKDIHDILNVYN